METRLRHRLEELRVEYEKGSKSLADLKTQVANLRTTLLRISGAVQVLQEELGEDKVAKAALPQA